MDSYNIAVAGTGYVGLSIATLLAQHNHVTAVDVIPEKVDLINRRLSPIRDEYIERYLRDFQLDLSATLDGWYASTSPHASWNVNVNNLHASAKTLSFLAHNIDGKHITVPPAVYRLGDINLHGQGSATVSGTATARAVVSTDVGQANIDMTLSPDRRFHGQLAASHVALGTLLDDTRFGNVSANLALRDALTSTFSKSHQVYFPDLTFSTDNGAMVASQGYYEFLSGVRASAGLNACANMAVDTLE